MADFTIDAELRTITGKKVKRVRAAGMVPITVYGPMIEPVNLQVPYRPLEVALMKAGGTNLIDINADGRVHTVLARDVQRDVLKGTILHVDFFAVDAKSKIVAEIPIHFIGVSPVVEAREGVLITGTNSVSVEALPGDLVNYIEVDLSKLKYIGDSITVADLDLGDKLVVLNDPADLLAGTSQTSAARSQMVESVDDEAAADQGITEPEVISRRKDDDEEA